MSHSHDIDPEALLSHVGWLRLLARRLVRDDSRADDLVQETILTALDHRSGPVRSLRGWLHRVLTHRAYGTRRADRRRLRRERAVARNEPVDSTPDDLASRAELHRLLVSLVLELNEPYRSTIILRFLDDRSIHDIARLQSSQPHTVRSRLARGLSLLRRRLDHEFGDDCHSWHLALLPVALPHPASLGPVVGASTSGSLTSSSSSVAAPTSAVASSAAGAASASLSPSSFSFSSVAVLFLHGAAGMSNKIAVAFAVSALALVSSGFALWSSGTFSGSSGATSDLTLSALTDLRTGLADLRDQLDALRARHDGIAAADTSRYEDFLDRLADLESRVDASAPLVGEADSHADADASTASSTGDDGWADLSDFARALSSSRDLLAKRHDGASLSPQDIAALDVLRGELTKASALARQRVAHPFFDPDYFRHLVRALFDEPFDLDERQRNALLRLQDQILAELPPSPEELTPLERHLARREAVAALHDGLAPLLDDSQELFAEGLFHYAEETLAGAGSLRLPLDQPSRLLLQNLGANLGLGNVSPDSPLVSLGEEFLSRSRDVIAQFGADAAAIDSLPAETRQVLDDRLLDIQLEFERAALPHLDPATREAYFARNPMVVQLRYDGGVVSRGVRHHF